jgi:hypothetical protein
MGRGTCSLLFVVPSGYFLLLDRQRCPACKRPLAFKAVGAHSSGVSRSGQVRSAAPSFDGQLGLRVARCLGFCRVASRRRVVPGRGAFGSALCMCSPSLVPSFLRHHVDLASALCRATSRRLIAPMQMRALIITWRRQCLDGVLAPCHIQPAPSLVICPGLQRLGLCGCGSQSRQ